MKKKTLIISTVIYFVIATSAFLYFGSNLIFPWQDKDKLLLTALKTKNIDKFEALLKKGANPNQIYGDKSEDWVMCHANELGNLPFLKLSIEYGGDVNLRNYTGSIYSAPIFCAATMDNYKAFRVLFDNKVDINIKEWPDATRIEEDNPYLKPEIRGKIFYGSPILSAADNNQYHSVYDMLQIKKELNWEEQYSLKVDLESDTIDPLSDEYKWRLKIAKLLRERGYDIDIEKVRTE